MDSVTNARSALQNGDVAEAMRSLNVVVENYPEIKSDTVYENLMNEISICENTISQYRNNYNAQVKEYKNISKFSRINRFFLRKVMNR